MKFVIVCMICCCFLAGCSSQSKDEIDVPGAMNAGPRQANVSGDTLTIAANTQAFLEDVRIGAGNIWTEDYTDASGAKKSGLTSGLWILKESNPPKNLNLRAYPGMTFTVSHFTLEVRSVTKDTVTLDIVKK